MKRGNSRLWWNTKNEERREPALVGGNENEKELQAGDTQITYCRVARVDPNLFKVAMFSKDGNRLWWMKREVERKEGEKKSSR